MTSAHIPMTSAHIPMTSAQRTTVYGADERAMLGRCRARFTRPIVYETDDGVPCTVDEANCTRGGGSTAGLKSKKTPELCTVRKVHEQAARARFAVCTVDKANCV